MEAIEDLSQSFGRTRAVQVLMGTLVMGASLLCERYVPTKPVGYLTAARAIGGLLMLVFALLTLNDYLSMSRSVHWRDMLEPSLRHRLHSIVKLYALFTYVFLSLTAVFALLAGLWCFLRPPATGLVIYECFCLVIFLLVWIAVDFRAHSFMRVSGNLAIPLGRDSISAAVALRRSRGSGRALYDDDIEDDPRRKSGVNGAGAEGLVRSAPGSARRPPFGPGGVAASAILPKSEFPVHLREPSDKPAVTVASSRPAPLTVPDDDHFHISQHNDPAPNHPDLRPPASSLSKAAASSHSHHRSLSGPFLPAAVHTVQSVSSFHADQHVTIINPVDGSTHGGPPSPR